MAPILRVGGNAVGTPAQRRWTKSASTARSSSPPFPCTATTPAVRWKCEAEAFEKAERRKAVELVDAAKRENRAPLIFATAAERWWHEVGQYTKETDLEDALKWLTGQIGGKRALHTIRDDDIAKAVAERRTHMVKAGHDDKGKQLYRPISARTVNRTGVYLLRRIMLRARDKWNTVIFKMPEWSEHALKEKKQPIRELMIEEEDRIAAIEGSYAAVREFATITGLRLDEVLLAWTQVDFDNAVVRLIAKGDEPRIVPLSKRAYAILWGERARDPEWVFTFVAKRTRTCLKTGQKIHQGPALSDHLLGHLDTSQAHLAKGWRQSALA